MAFFVIALLLSIFISLTGCGNNPSENQKLIGSIESHVQDLEKNLNKMDNCLEYLIETESGPSVDGICDVFKSKGTQEFAEKIALFPTGPDLNDGSFSEDEKLIIEGLYQQIASLHRQSASRIQRLLDLDDAYKLEHSDD